jgi:hypothetical protein
VPEKIITVSPKVEAGIGTVVGILAALAQYGGALIVFLSAANQSSALPPLITATATLITVIAGRMHQAASATKAAAMLGPLPLTDPTVGVAGDTLEDDEDGGEGDELDSAFDGLETDPSTIPPDEGEGPDASEGILLAAAHGSPAISRLNAKQRLKARAMVVQALYLALHHAPNVHYTQGVRRWEGIKKGLRAWRGEFPHYADCSAFATWALWQGLFHFGVGDVVNGERFQAGFTGTMLRHGKVVHNPRGYLIGDCAIYGRPGTTGAHTAVFVGYKKGVPYVISHGSENGPFLLPMHYRDDLIEVRRYI